MNKELIRQFKELASTDLASTFEQLFSMLSSVPEANDLLNALIIKKASYNDLKKNISLNVISTEDAARQQNQILYGTVSFIDQLSELPEIQYTVKFPNEIPPKPPQVEDDPEKPDPITRKYNIMKINKMLEAAFSDEMLNEFCSWYFPEIQNNFTVGQNKKQRIMLLIDSCKRRLQLGKLLHLVSTYDDAKAQYDAYVPYF